MTMNVSDFTPLSNDTTMYTFREVIASAQLAGYISLSPKDVPRLMPYFKTHFYADLIEAIRSSEILFRGLSGIELFERYLAYFSIPDLDVDAHKVLHGYQVSKKEQNSIPTAVYIGTPAYPPLFADQYKFCKVIDNYSDILEFIDSREGQYEDLLFISSDRVNAVTMIRYEQIKTILARNVESDVTQPIMVLH